jgi:hypothetical protein
MKSRTFIAALATLVVGALMFAMAPAATAARPATTSLGTVPVSGTATDATGAPAGSFSGTFDLTRFTTQNGALAVVGTLSGTLVDTAGAVLGTVSQTATMQVTAAGSCQILHLELGPLDLDLLGLQVHLDQVVLDITAQSGPGNLLGNLLCGIAGLLDGNAPLNQVVALLNQLLALLG